LADDVAIQEQQRAESLLLSGRRQVSLLDQMTEETTHVRRAQFAGVAEPVEADEPLGPVDIGFFSAPAHVLESQIGLQRLQELRLVLHSNLTAEGRANIRRPATAIALYSADLGAK
jgi:hypothetical protein